MRADPQMEQTLGGVTKDAVERLISLFESEMRKQADLVVSETRSGAHQAASVAVGKMDHARSMVKRLHAELERRAGKDEDGRSGSN